MFIKKLKTEGASLRTIQIFLIVGVIFVSAVVIFSTFHLSGSFRDLAETSEKQIELRKAARELMDASDYLTENVQRFTVHGERRFMDNYFEEAFKSKHREDAVAIMAKESASGKALLELQSAMSDSLHLMNREYYAMRLVTEALGSKDVPAEIAAVELSAADSAKSADEKLRLASEMVHDDAYYAEKDRIRTEMRASLDALEAMAYDVDESAINSLRKEMIFVRVIVLIAMFGTFVMVWLISRLGIHPLLNAVDRIRADNTIPEAGANEFRYLARAYNKMYDAYRSSLERLNFKASHDELTGVYNRSGYDLLFSSIDLASTCMLLFDVDNFKGVNDTYGHKTGDKVLVRLAEALRGNFRADDYICRIGGDEFVVFMSHSPERQDKLIADKIDSINAELGTACGDIPAVSVSVGVAHGSAASGAEDLFKKTDAAMYESKLRGKKTYTFYSESTVGREQ